MDPTGRLRAAVAQMNSTPDRAANLMQAERLVAEAAAAGANLVGLPENFSLLTEGREKILAGAERIDGPVVGALRSWAKRHGIWLLGGSVHLASDASPGHVTNTSLLVTPEGEIAAHYDKIHLFDVDLSGDRSYRESSTVLAGEAPVAAETPWGTAGLTVCYDLRFPELYRALAARGARILFIPSSFTALTGAAHWDILTRARAVENQAFVLAPTQTGSPYPGRHTYGHSRIVDPWGKLLAEVPEGVGIACADLDFAELERVRRELPALKHRRL